MLRGVIKAALEEGFEDAEVRKYFGMKKWETVTPAKRRRLARHKVGQFIRAFRDVFEFRMAHFGDEGVNINGFGHFTAADNWRKEKPKGLLYPCLDAFVVPRGQLVEEIQEAALMPGCFTAEALPAVVEMPGPYEVTDAHGDLTNFQYIGPAVGNGGEPSDVGVFAIYAPQGLDITTRRGDEVKTERFTWVWYLFAVGWMWQTGFSTNNQFWFGFEPGECEDYWPGCPPERQWINWPAQKQKAPEPHEAWRFEDYQYRSTASAEGWLKCFPRKRWAVKSGATWRHPVWLTARQWWSKYGAQAEYLAANGYEIPPPPKDYGGVKRIVGKMEWAAFDLID